MTTLLYSENQYKSQQQRFCSLRWLGLSRIANTSFFSQHRPLDTLESTALTTPNTLKQVFEAKHLSIADSILRSRCCPLQRGFTVQYSDAYLRSPHDSRPNSFWHYFIGNKPLTSFAKKCIPNFKGVLNQPLVIRYLRKLYGTRPTRVWFSQDLLGRDSQKTIQAFSSIPIQMEQRCSMQNEDTTTYLKLLLVTY